MNYSPLKISFILFIIASLMLLGYADVQNCDDANCKSCPEELYLCDDCYNGYIADNGTCTSCSDPNCQDCTNIISNCSACLVGYGFKNKQCQYCEDQNCLLCQDEWNKCTECLEGYGLKNNKCAECTDSLCRLCPSNSNTCESCMAGYDKVDGICSKCSTNCIICVSTTKCTTCANSYYVNSNNLCSKCIQNCAKCSAASQCDLCIQNYQFNSNSMQCQKKKVNKDCPDACSACSTQILCTSCKSGFYLKSGQCIPCVQNCKTCSNGNSCDQCYDRFKFVKNANSCRRCQGQQCLSCPNDVAYCQQCKKGYEAVNYQCKKLSLLNCIQQTKGKCTTCITGFVALDSGLCFQCIQGCQQCSKSNLQSCDKCVTGTYLKDKKCQSCKSVCLACSSQTICSSCISGYYLSDSLYCYRDCKDANCKSCPVSYTVCQTCFRGYKVSNGKCEQDLACNFDASCTGCPEKYYLQNSVCNACPTIDNCKKCKITDPNVCAQCMTGYFLSAATVKCTKCPTVCTSCQTDSICNSCIDGYYLELSNGQSTGLCSKCDSSCLTCYSDSAYCTSCPDEYQQTQSKMCLPSQKLSLTTQYDMDFSKYSETIPGIKTYYAQSFGLDDPNYVQITGAYQRSVIILAEVHVPVSQSVQNAATIANEKLSQNATINGISITASQITVIKATTTTSTAASQSSPLGMIVGIVLGSVGLLVVIGISVVVWHSKRKANKLMQVKSQEERGFASKYRNSGTNKEIMGETDQI